LAGFVRLVHGPQRQVIGFLPLDVRQLKCGRLLDAGLARLERTGDEILFRDDGSTLPLGGFVVKVGVDDIGDDIRILEFVIGSCAWKTTANVSIANFDRRIELINLIRPVPESRSSPGAVHFNAIEIFVAVSLTTIIDRSVTSAGG
jgi:hypothetical protein